MRAAIASYYHYMQNISARRALLGNLIVGKRWHGSWSSHVGAWALSGRPNTFALRHKDYVAANMYYPMRISDFIGLPEPKSASVDFAQLQEQFPNFSEAARIKNMSPSSKEMTEGFTGRFTANPWSGWDTPIALPIHSKFIRRQDIPLGADTRRRVRWRPTFETRRTLSPVPAR